MLGCFFSEKFIIMIFFFKFDFSFTCLDFAYVIFALKYIMIYTMDQVIVNM